MLSIVKKSKVPLDGHHLYCYPTCGACTAVRLSAWWMGIKLPTRNVLMSSEYAAELVAGGGKTQVPCLRIEGADGGVRWMYESSDIIDYLKELPSSST